jgi:hypothetical protein
MKLNCFTKVSLIININTQHPDELASSWHSFYNCHKQLHQITALLINLCVIQIHSAAVLTYCDQSVDSCCHSDAHKLYSLANLNHTPGTRLPASLSPFGQQVINIRFVSIVELQNVLPLISTSKSLTIHSNRLHYVLGEGCMYILGDGDDQIYQKHSTSET